MTEEEHKARAMLMDALYVSHFGYYRFPRFLMSGSRPIHRVDALTLEELSTEEVERRRNHKPVKDIWYD